LERKERLRSAFVKIEYVCQKRTLKKSAVNPLEKQNWQQKTCSGTNIHKTSCRGEETYRGGVLWMKKICISIGRESRRRPSLEGEKTRGGPNQLRGKFQTRRLRSPDACFRKRIIPKEPGRPTEGRGRRKDAGYRDFRPRTDFDIRERNRIKWRTV